MARFHSMSHVKLLALLNSVGVVAGDLYYATDTHELFIACTTTEGNVGIAKTGLIMTGHISMVS